MGDSLQLQDIHLPPSPGLWPLAPGWWLLLAIILVVTVWLTITIYRGAKHKKKQQKILNKYKALEDILKKSPSNEVIAKINILLRQLAVTQFPRSQIASLTGGDWLHFLDQSGETQGFTKGAGRILIDAPYRHGELQNLNLDEFTPLIGSWIKKTITHKTRISDSSRLTDELSLKKGGGVS